MWAIVDPVAHVALMTVLFQAIARTPALGLSFPLFFASGYLPYSFYHRMSSFLAGTMKANKALLSYPIVSPIDAIVSRFVLQIMTDTVIASAIIAGIIYVGGVMVSINLAGLMVAALAGAVLGLGIGMVNIVLFARSPLYEQVFGIVTRPLFMVSGVFFLVEDMPHPFGDYLLYNPLVHVIMWFRNGMYPEYRAELLDKGYVIECAAVAVMLGLALLTVSMREIRENRL